MSFNLNKNDGSAPHDPSNRSKFDLSKSDTPDTAAPAKKPAYWLWVLLALVFVGAGAWYFTSASGNRNLAVNEPVSPPAVKPVQAAGADKGKPAVSAADSLRATSNAQPVAADTVKPAGSLPAKDRVPKDTAAAPQAPGALSNPVAASFHSGSAAFVKISRAAVKDIKRSAKAGGNGLINVNGYASSEGDLAFNQKISQARADIFKRYLVSKGMSENMIVATGKGIENPIAPNNTEAGRKKNRRVEVIIPQ